MTPRKLLEPNRTLQWFATPTGIAVACAAIPTALTGCSSHLVPLRQIEEAEAKWNSRAIQNYSYVLEDASHFPGTECSQDSKVEVEVLDGRTVKFGSCRPDAAVAQSYGSVASLFEIVRAERKARSPLFEVRFEPSLGYPESIYINHSPATADYSVQYFIRDFRVTEK